MTFEAATLRERSRRSGISGCATRASMATNTPAAAPRRRAAPSVRGAVQPISLPPTIANTASISAAVTVTAPPTSRRGRSAVARAAGSSARLSAITPMPIGRLTRKIQCQL